MERIPTYKMVREIPKDVKVVEEINGIKLYNMNIFQNIMSWNQHNLDVTALEYFGNKISYGQLPQFTDEYAKGFESLGIKKDSIVTLSLPVSNEYFLSLFAFHNMGAISNNVNFLFLRNDMARYTLEKNSDTIIVLDVYLPLIADQLKKSQVKNVILTSLSDYLPEDQKLLFADLNKMPSKVKEFLMDSKKMAKAMGELASLRNVEFITMDEIRNVGKKSTSPIIYPDVDIKKDAIYSYTSGTTGAPKCIVFTEESPNAIVEMHNGLDLDEYVGDRSLVLIPASHATGMFYAGYLQLAKGKTLVLQSIYDKKSFANDLKEYNIQHTLAPASFYLEGAKEDEIEENGVTSLRRPCSGGEPISNANVHVINNWLHKIGCKKKVAIGGGAGEVGSSALTSYDLDEETKTNETGYPIPGVKVKIVDPKTGEEVKQGERGIIHISSAASANRYLNNPEATDAYYYYDKDGTRWAILGDIAVQNKDGSYSMLGRASDSYVDENGEVKYLFDIEYSLEIDDPVMEWEISAFKSDNKTDVVAQVVLKKEYQGKVKEMVEFICNKYNLDGVKFYDTFETSEVTGKRDYQLLKHDYVGYLSPYDTENFILKNYSETGFTESKIVSSEVLNKKVKKLTKVS